MLGPLMSRLEAGWHYEIMRSREKVNRPVLHRYLGGSASLAEARKPRGQLCVANTSISGNKGPSCSDNTFESHSLQQVKPEAADIAGSHDPLFLKQAIVHQLYMRSPECP